MTDSLPADSSPASKTRKTRRGAFTLIELLASVAIIAVLALLISPTVGRVQSSSYDAACLNNMRSMGAAMTAYIAEHDSYLPGPGVFTQSPFFLEGDLDKDNRQSHLAVSLAPYSTISKSRYGNFLQNDMMICPAWIKAAPRIDFNYSSTVAPRKYVKFQGKDVSPWGETAQGTFPLKLPALNDAEDASGQRVGLSKLEALVETDGDLFSAYPSVNNWGDVIPPHPVHPKMQNVQHPKVSSNMPNSAITHAHPGAYRNALFFDFHVGRVDLDGNPL